MLEGFKCYPCPLNPSNSNGNPEELKHCTQGLSVKIIARNLKRPEKSVKGWLDGERKIPFWVPKLLRLRHMEKTIQMRQMGFGEQLESPSTASK